MNILDKIIYKLSKKMYIIRFIKKNNTNINYGRLGDTYFYEVYNYYNIKLNYNLFEVKNGKYSHYLSDLDRNLNYKKNTDIFIVERLEEYYNEIYPLFERILLNGKLEEKLQTKKTKEKINKI